MIKIIRNNSMVPHIGLLSLYEQTLFCEKNSIEGDFVECCVWKGGAVGLMTLVNLIYGKKRRDIHLFDSFEEICEPDEEIDGCKKTVDEFHYTLQRPYFLNKVNSVIRYIFA